MNIYKYFQHKLITIRKLVLSIYLRCKNYKEPNDLVNSHFRYLVNESHVNKNMFICALNNLKSNKPVIIETGTSAWGCDSTSLLDLFAFKSNGIFHTVDIRESPMKELRSRLKNTFFHVSDSVTWLQEFLPTLKRKVDLVFLDSWDVNWKNPLPSAEHGLNEFKELLSFLADGAIVIIDDTPKILDYIPAEFHENALKFKTEYGVLPGKGAFILTDDFTNNFCEIIYHDYGVVLIKK